MQGEGTIKEITALRTVLSLDSGREVIFLNTSVLTGAVAVAKITKEQPPETLPK